MSVARFRPVYVRVAPAESVTSRNVSAELDPRAAAPG